MAVLAALIILWRSIGSESAASPSQTHAPSTSEPEPAAPSAPSTGVPSGSVARNPLPQLRRPDERVEEPSAPRPSSAEGGAEQTPEKSQTGPQWGIPQMRAQVAANEGKVNECLAQAGAADKRISGDATLTFIAAKKGDKIIIEDTSVDHDGTTLKDEGLVDCLQGTSKALAFEGLPRNANAVFVTRTVKVENGALVENKLVKFSYMR